MTKRERDVVFTYRYLRGAMIALLLMLMLAVGVQWFSQLHETGRSCLLGSISAYYYTPARTIFVGSLCALGAALIAYRGHTSEQEVLLNFSGTMAFVVAMVPTAVDSRCGDSGFALTEGEIEAAVQNNILTLIAVSAVALLVIRALTATGRHRRAGSVSAAPARHRSTSTVCISVACTGVLLVELTLFCVLRARFIAVSHNVAATTMVAGVIAVMVFSALQSEHLHYGDDRRGAAYRRIYAGLALALGLLLTATVTFSVLIGGQTHIVLVAEVIVIVLFGAYWVVQTKELWHLRETASPLEHEPVAATPASVPVA